LAQMLLGKRTRIGPGARLHRSGLLVLSASDSLVGAIDLLLNVALSARGFFRVLGERVQAAVGFAHGASGQAVWRARWCPCTGTPGRHDRNCAPAPKRTGPRRAGPTRAGGHLPLAALPWGHRGFEPVRPAATPRFPASPDSLRRSEDARHGRR